MNILLVTFYYPPDPAMGAVRTGALAQYLLESGHHVHVLTSQGPTFPSVDYVSRIDWRDPRTAFRWFSVVANQGPQDVQEPWKSPSFLKPLRRKFRQIAKGFIEQPDRSFPWIRPAIRQGRDIIKSESIDVIIASGPPFTTFVVAARLAEEFSIPWAADYRDLWTRGHYFQFGSIRRKIDNRLERRLLRSASLVTTVSPLLTDQMSLELSRTVLTIPNGVDAWANNPLEERRPLSSARVTIAYVGAELYEGRRSPKTLFDAAQQLRLTPHDICFMFIGLQGHSSEELVNRLARESNVAHLVEVTPPVSRDECMRLQSRADALLLLLWDHPDEKAVLTGKLFEYIAVQRPILVVGCSDGLAAHLVQDHNLGYVVGDIETAKATLEDLIASKLTHEGINPDISSNAVSIFGRSAYLSDWTAAISALGAQGAQQ